ncbi:P-loop containing nucleoside triphosphate hydrolase protein [Cristinia sonorae]|uniref:P-loop containing nucleoside triphosphate hydrolase protein n=1 Tax=Cristinia sonorae TaxID=1940300 RepID=A0A8K0XPI5_9AGAR|nr:P-loop containing nucleoside triphosphate hydrolase protein [Cristinia sonorae]
MRLRTLGEPLTNDLIDALEELNIKSDIDLIFSNTPTEIWLKLPPETIPLKELNNIVVQLIEKLSAPAYTCVEMFDSEIDRLGKLQDVELSCGVRELDEMVGGFGVHHMLEISGEKGSGKTSLALQIILRQLARYPNSSAVWIDTTGDTSPDRMSSMLEQIGDEPGVQSALQRLQITRAFDVDELQQAIEELRLSLSMKTVHEQHALRTIVIDPITPVFRPLLNAISSQGHATMTFVMRQLRILAETFNLTILILNATSAAQPNNPSSHFPSTTRKPALGPSFTYTSDATLWLARAESVKELQHLTKDDSGSGEVYVAEVLRSRRVVSPFAIQGG